MSDMSWQEADDLARAMFLDQEARRSVLADREAGQYADPFTPSPPSPEESAYVAEGAALLTVAADRLERLIAGGSPLPWAVTLPDCRRDGAHCSCGLEVHAGDTVVAGSGYQDGGIANQADAGLIVALVNAGPALVAWLRNAARDAAEGYGADRFAVKLARQIMGEGESA